MVGRSKIKIEGYEINGLANRDIKSGGLLIATQKGTDIETIITAKDSKLQQMWAIIRSKGYSCRICIAYGYPSEHRVTDEEIEDWFISMEEEYLKHPELDTLLIGDFNAHTGLDKLPINKNGKNLNSLVERRNLINLNCEKWCEGKYTREDPKGTRTVIDYAIVDENLMGKVKKVYIDDKHKFKVAGYKKVGKKSKETATDHNAIVIDLEVPVGKNKEKIVKWNFTNEDCLKKFNSETENINMKEQWKEEGDIEEKYKRWEKQIQSLIYKCFNRITIKNKTSNKETKDLINAKRTLNQTISEIQALNLESNIVLESLKEKKTDLLEEITEKLSIIRGKKMKNSLDEISKSKVREDIWSIRKKNIAKDNIKHSVNDKDGNILTTKKEVIERYQEYYKELLTNRKIPDEYKEHKELLDNTFQNRMNITIYDDLPINRIFTEKELNNVIKSMKNGRAPGPDQITYEILKNAGKNLRKNILDMINYFWLHEKIPSRLQCLFVKTMYKGKGSIAELENQRGIFLGSNNTKTYEKMIMNRIYPNTESYGFTEYQCGGRKGMSPTDQVFVLRAALEYMIYMGKEYYVEFCDLKKAFDKMILKNVLDDLWNSNVKGRIWRNVFAINQNTDIIIKTPYGESDKIKVQQVLKQGSVMASSLAALHTDSSNKFMKNDLGISYGNLHIRSLLFQDDIARIECKAQNLNIANRVYEVFQNINGMQFHETKTVYISNKKKEKITINNTELIQKKAAKYLGDIITDDNKYDENIEDRKSSINGIVAEIRYIMNEAQEDIEIQAAKQYHEGIVVAKLLYNCETWTNLTKKNIEDLEKIQNNSIKRLLRIPFSTPSLGLLYELGIPSINAAIHIKKLAYLHKLQQSDKSLAHKVLQQQKELLSNHFLKETTDLLKKYQLTEDLDEIKKLSKEKWKNISKKAVLNHDRAEMESWCRNSTKCRNLVPNGSKNQESYINMIDSPSAKVLLLERLNMTDVKDNYHGNYRESSLHCNLCDETTETTMHLLKCSALATTTPEIIDNYRKLMNHTVMLPGDLKLLAKTITDRLEARDKLQITAAFNSSVDANTV